MVGEMARTLTLGQRRFAEAIVEGKKPIDAYRAAYPGRDTGAYAAASRLLRHPLVILEMMNIRGDFLSVRAHLLRPCWNAWKKSSMPIWRITFPTIIILSHSKT